MFEYAKEVREAYARLKIALQQEEAAKQHMAYARKRVTKMHEGLSDAIAKAAQSAAPGIYTHDLDTP